MRPIAAHPQPVIRRALMRRMLVHGAVGRTGTSCPEGARQLQGAVLFPQVAVSYKCHQHDE